MAGQIHSIQPLDPPLVPPEGSKPAGVSPHGRHLWTLTRQRSRGVPWLDQEGMQAQAQLDDELEAGSITEAEHARQMARVVKQHRLFRKNQMTGEPLYPLNRPEVYEEAITFYLESDGQGNIVCVPFTAPTAAEIAAEERQRRIREMVPAVAEALVDAEFSPEQLVKALRGNTAPEPEVEQVSYPRYYGPGLWYLSAAHEAACKAGDEQGFKGKKDDAIPAAADYVVAQQHARQAVEV